MTHAALGAVCHHLRTLTATALPDRQLLENYLARREEAAFAALVRRHGPMVLQVCRRVLRQEQDAEDAFQATFLVLARKASGIRKRDSVASWLHGVAYRVAGKARAAAARRSAHEQRQSAAMATGSLDEVAWRELRTVLDAELERLPEKYRSPLVLCYLEGQTQDEAAARLGWSKGTFRKRLERGRQLLRDRLGRRGLALAAGLLAPLLGEPATAASLPASLAAATARFAVSFASGSATLAVPAKAAALANKTLQALLLAKWKLPLVVLLVAGLVLAGVGGLALPARVASQPEEAAQAPPPDAAPAERVADNPVRTDALGDPLPPGATARLGTLRFRNGHATISLAFSPDGKMLASGSLEAGLRVWETAKGAEAPLPQFVPGTESRSVLVAFAPDGKLLATADYYGNVFLKDATTGKNLHAFPPLDRPMSRSLALVFAPDSATLVSVSFVPDEKQERPQPQFTRGTSVFRVLDTASGKELRRFQGRPMSEWCKVQAAFLPDGKTLAAGGEDADVHLWDVTAGKEIGQFKGKKDGLVRSLTLSPDGKTLAATCSVIDDGWDLYLWETATGKETGHKKGLGSSCLAFAPDGKTLARAESYGTVSLWDVTTWEKKQDLKGRGDTILALAFVPNGKALAVSIDNRLQLWDAATGKELHCYQGHERMVSFVGYSPGGTLVSGDADGVVNLWKTATAEQVRRWEKDLVNYPKVGSPLALAPDGKTIACASDGQYIRLRDLATGDFLATGPRKGKTSFGWDSGQRGCRSWAFSPDGRLFAAGGEDHILYLWDVAADKEIHRLQGLPQSGAWIAFSPDGKTLVSAAFPWKLKGGGKGGVGGEEPIPAMLYLWDLATGKEVRRFAAEPGGFNFVAFSPDGKSLITTGLEGTVCLWDPATGKERRRFAADKQAAFHAWALSPDGKTLATARRGESVIYLWELATGKERWRFTGHRGEVRSLAFSPDGKALASGSEDTTILVWDLAGLGRDPRKPAAELTARELADYWSDLAGADATKAFRAIAILASTPKQALPALKKWLRPVPPVDERKVARLLADLGSEEFTVRQQATEELEKLGSLVESELRKVLAGQPALETRRRVEQLLEKATADQVPSGEALQVLRAVELLERSGSAEAKDLLEALAKGAPGALATRQARASLDRLAKRQADAP
jgi:RNA polymerase sigma factor (sigma-70 family)